MLPEILEQSISKEHRIQGFWLCVSPTEKDTVNLIYKGSCMDSWDKYHVTFKQVEESIQSVLLTEKLINKA